MITLDDQVKAVEREIKFREYVYPRRVDAGKMTKAKADHELAVMEAVLITVTAERDKGRLL